MLAAGTAHACKLDDIGTGVVRAALDGRVLLLADGREVRLAGLETPQHDEAALTAARDRLGALALGRTLALKRLDPAPDRYGRIVAFAHRDEETRSLQEMLLAQGHARAAAHIGDAGCAKTLLAAEREARGAARGLWSDPAQALRRADRPAEILADRGRFAIVEGRVASVRESGATVYVNFGRRWSEDFTASLLKRHQRTFAAAGIDLAALAGRTVRIRGIVEERGGPWIELLRPEQIEIEDP